MSAASRSLSEISEQAISVLLREIGFGDTLRFVQYLTGGFGNYTAEMRERIAEVTPEEIYEALKQGRTRNHSV